jgi:2-polyprenyl-3-methyl-5-hydroxy-6-metoxy-1,4-benzoquinol methylase
LYNMPVYPCIMTEHDEYFEANRLSWNQRTKVHRDSAFYNVAGFKEGATVLTPIELGELGDIKGKRLLHLQCHFGLDTLNLARLGAEVTGVDLSDEAIKTAKELNAELKMGAKFICCNLYDLKEHLTGSYDMIFTSYGTIGWLPDLDKWAGIVAHYLKPGGVFYMADFHPVAWMFDDEFTHIKYHYDNREVIVTENSGTYTDRKADIKAKEYGWNHGTGELLNSLIKHGLRIEQFNEFMYSPYSVFPNSVETAEGQWQIKGLEGKIPLVYSLRAVRH